MNEIVTILCVFLGVIIGAIGGALIMHWIFDMLGW
jgi:hypothetical protein